MFYFLIVSIMYQIKTPGSPTKPTTITIRTDPDFWEALETLMRHAPPGYYGRSAAIRAAVIQMAGRLGDNNAPVV